MARKAIALLLPLMLLVASCAGNGNNNQTGDDPQAAGTEEQAAGTEESATGEGPIVFGGLPPLTGAGAEYGPSMLTAMEMAADEVNESGGVLGEELRLVVEDAETNPDAAVRAASKLIDVNKAVALLGTWDSGSTLAAAPRAIEAGVLLMNTSGSPDISELEDDDLVWRFEAPGFLTGEAWSKAATQQGWKRASTMAMNDPSALGDIEGFVEAFEADGGEIVDQVVYNAEQSNYRTEIDEVASGDPDVIVIAGYTPELTVIFREAYEAGIEVPWMGQAFAINDDLLENVGAEPLENVMAVNTIPDVDSEAYERIAEDFRQRTGQTLVSNVYAAQAFDMVIVAALAFESCECRDAREAAQSIRDVTGGEGETVFSYVEAVERMRNGEPINYSGVSSALEFDENGDPRPDFGLFRMTEEGLELVEPIPLG